MTKICMNPDTYTHTLAADWLLKPREIFTQIWTSRDFLEREFVKRGVVESIVLIFAKFAYDTFHYRRNI